MTEFLRDKRQVSQQFNRAARCYDSAATVQQQAADTLLDLLQEQHLPLNGHWADIGCGTGYSFASLLKLGAGQVSGIDLASGMLETAAARKLPNIQLIQADADDLPLATDSQDGIFSSLMIQWSEHPQHTLQEWARVLKPGGTLAIATLLPGTHRELQTAWRKIDNFRHVNPFTSQHELTRSLFAAGLVMTRLHQHQIQPLYSNMSELLHTLKAIGATNVNQGRRPGLAGRALLRALDQHYPRNADGRLPLSYEVCWLLATKQPGYETAPNHRPWMEPYRRHQGKIPT
ncbi:malonyl-ACP O-methyltransferase BioC [Parathalassolituus penaei]|uniref:Malonyl-[acyl-carrier protein] O-methyltransferase n=1 Tax=Parathalassolituus penaei TaxID=2997323 RepID=A0A9X3IQE1_9GAMM|nr:malonyl-ACP O-methyltransferase BioC [Parathalassolituus penaei]MCY0963696.1 malonyl-ACP O-methyltransferase BioC [Parathalassolituus penaei]